MIHADCAQYPELRIACGCDVVRGVFLEFTEALEGGVPWLYADIRNLITIAYGNLVDPLSAALTLPLMHAGGIPASKSEITAAWLAVKGDPKAAGYGHQYAKKLTTLRLTGEGMASFALAKYDSNDRTLRARCSNWDTLPATARLALHSLAWACGANAHFPRLFSDVNARDFDGAAVEIHMNEYTPEGIKNAGLVPRNVANKILMRNAQRVDAFKLDPDLLEWKRDLAPDQDTVPTLREFPSTASQPSIYVDRLVGGELVDDPDDAA